MRTGPILIVDDDLDIRELLAEALEDLGVPAITAMNGLEAAKLVRSMPSPPTCRGVSLVTPRNAERENDL